MPRAARTRGRLSPYGTFVAMRKPIVSRCRQMPKPSGFRGGVAKAIALFSMVASQPETERKFAYLRLRQEKQHTRPYQEITARRRRTSLPWCTIRSTSVDANLSSARTVPATSRTRCWSTAPSTDAHSGSTSPGTAAGPVRVQRDVAELSPHHLVDFYRSKHRVDDCTYGRRAVIGKT